MPAPLPGLERGKIVPAMVCFTGDRDARWTLGLDAIVRDFLNDVKMHCRPVLVIHGDCRGFDRIAGNIAEQMRFPVTPYPYIKGVGRAGGPLRNTQMVNVLLSHRARGGYALVAMHHDHFERSTGTRNMVEQSTAASIPVVTI